MATMPRMKGTIRHQSNCRLQAGNGETALRDGRLRGAAGGGGRPPARPRVEVLRCHTKVWQRLRSTGSEQTLERLSDKVEPPLPCADRATYKASDHLRVLDVCFMMATFVPRRQMHAQNGWTLDGL